LHFGTHPALSDSMTVSAAIETGAGNSPLPGLDNQGKITVAAHGARQAGVEAQSVRSSAVQGTASFRAGWQLLLAQMNSSGKSSSTSETGTVLASSANEVAPGELALKSSVPISAPASLANVRAKLEAEKGSEAPGDAAKIITDSTRSVEFASRETTGSATSTSSKSVATHVAVSKAETSKRESPGGWQTTRSSDNTQIEAAAAGTAAVPVQDAIVIHPQAALVASLFVPAAIIAAQSAQTTPTTDSSATPASDSLISHPPELSRSTEVALRTTTAAQEAAGGSETQANQASPIRNQSEPSGSIQGEQKSLGACESAAPADRMNSQGEGAPELPARALKMSQETAPNQDTTPTAVQGKSPILLSTPNRVDMQTVVGEQNPTQTITPSQNADQSMVRSENAVERRTLSESRINVQPAVTRPNVASASTPQDASAPLPGIATSTAAFADPLPAESSIPGKPDIAGGGKTSAAESLRPLRSRGSNSDSVSQASHTVPGETASPAVDLSSLTRGVTGAGGVVSTAFELAGASSGSTNATDSRETFATLDAAGSTEKPTWIHASAQRAEAGYQDPALGWVSVRADSSGGVIHAQLVPGSADAAQALGGHLAGLNSYLAEHHTSVETLAVASPESGWSGLDSGSQGAGAGTQQGAGQQAAKNADTGLASAASSDLNPLPAASELLESFAGQHESKQNSWPGGVHISVMA
jgi:hypothetical protein